MGAKAVVMSGVDIPRFAESYNTVRAIDFLAAGYIVFLACGLGNPCFSTDSAVVLRAIELECDAILMAKNIDGVYTADPHADPSATLIPEITYAEASGRDLRVMDAAAFIMLRENAFPLVRVFGPRKTCSRCSRGIRWAPSCTPNGSMEPLHPALRHRLARAARGQPRDCEGKALRHRAWEARPPASPFP